MLKLFHYYFIAFFLCALPFASMAQSQQISGTVYNNTDQTLEGVSVTLKGQQIGTITNSEGRFSINVRGSNSVLVFTYVGYKPKELVAGNQSNVSVILEPLANEGEEVVVIGYGQRKRSDLTSSVASVQAADIVKSNPASADQALQGRATGVFVQNNGGNPNESPTIRIRGVTSWNFAEPLYVIDGIPIVENDIFKNSTVRGNFNIMSTINPNDIEQISVLKDGSATAIYGNRAANGVILITTKKGSAGKTKVDARVSKGFNYAIKDYAVLSTQQLIALIKESYKNDPFATISANESAALEKYKDAPTYDWQAAITKKVTRQNDASVRLYGGAGDTRYNFSLGYSNNEGNYGRNTLERYSGILNLSTKVLNIVEVGVSNKFSRTGGENTTNIEGVSYNVAMMAGATPWQPIYDATDPYGFAKVPRPILSGMIDNAAAQYAFNYKGSRILRNNGNVYMQIEPVKELKFRVTYGIDWVDQRNISWADNLAGGTYGKDNKVNLGDGTSMGKFSETTFKRSSQLFQANLNYGKTIGSHRLDFLVGFDDQYTLQRTTEAANVQNPSRDRERWVLNGGGNKEYISFVEAKVPDALRSWLGRVSYNFASKYYIDANFRRDGSSRFAPGYQWDNFYGFSAAWRISNEEFMSGVDWLNDLKLKGGYGKIGSMDAVIPFSYLPSVSQHLFTAFGVGATNTNLANALRWERIYNTSIGIEGAALNNRLSFSAEYYNRKTDGIVQTIPLPLSALSNSANPVFSSIINIGMVKNNGMEFMLGYRDKITKDFGFNIEANLTTTKNKVLQTYNNIAMGGYNGRIQAGYPINYFWGLQTDGIIRTEAEAIEYKNRIIADVNIISPVARAFRNIGDYKYKDQNGDSALSDKDYVYLGSSIPGYFYGINLGFNYKEFGIDFLFNGVGDVQKYNKFRKAGEAIGGGAGNRWATVLNRYTATNQNADMPRALATDPVANSRESSRWIENAGFFRLNNINAYYNLPGSLLGKTFISAARVFVSVNNVFVITKYKGLDPEEDAIGPSYLGNVVFPPVRSLILGVNLSF